MEIAWTVTGIVVPLLIALAFALATGAGISAPEFFAAKSAFAVAFAAFAVMTIFWLTNAKTLELWKLGVGAFAGIFLCLGLPATLRWVATRQSRILEIKDLSRFLNISTPILNLYEYSGNPIFHGIRIDLQNVGNEMVRGHLEDVEVVGRDSLFLTEKTRQLPPIGPGQQLQVDINRSDNDMGLNLNQPDILLSLTMKYDTVPESGERISVRRIRYRLIWHEGHIVEIHPNIVDSDER